ncbi:2-amino-4-hydroxy-6-hydroxymethyldihydropteridine diphosphokinase [Lacimicrobium alkaliphilum]|uniref:2-amino-4-hydroxy-6-hydroxymethyldihydropteridine pyrophosphokinase n=1 Tax=Lacimicrobium alkaliphilum TaxID=1526571 RepID=A0A0U3AW91_9ALTE|nr:2-amino-4-hydroxy-6-hydroxymethyldihydropteridine diphosphokinase [Lacimicrobium alkaliphilum]ALS97224.1 2-amino-4-hydroxy-6-hydroxymethyldihydropteridine pyrophosphokinase [Lacimicrobium alkaliphilum]
MTVAFVGLGSNLANPQQQLLDALHSLTEAADVRLLSCSSFYQSLPMGPQDQPDYLNGVAKLDTSLSANGLLDLLQSIEQQQGRVRKAERWGARTLDLDLLLFGQQQINSERLTVPHYGLAQREFVLYPLFELSPELILPDGTALSVLVEECHSKGLRVVFNGADVWKSVTGSV